MARLNMSISHQVLERIRHEEDSVAEAAHAIRVDYIAGWVVCSESRPGPDSLYQLRLPREHRGAGKPRGILFPRGYSDLCLRAGWFRRAERRQLLRGHQPAGRGPPAVRS